MNLRETQYGFEYGPVKITRACSDNKKGWVILLVETKRHNENKPLSIYVTKTGKVRFYNGTVEWKPAKK